MLSSQKMMSAPSGGGADDNFKNVTLLLNGDGTNGGQNNTFLDSSTNAFTITRNGNTTQGSFSPYGSNWGNYFNGSSYIGVANNAAFDFGTGSVTVEAWINTLVKTSYQNIVGSYDGGSNYWFLQTNGDGGITCGLGTNDIGTTTNICDGQWHHVAMVRNGSSNVTLYIDGAVAGTFTDSTNINTNAAVNIGYYASGATRYFTGYISNVRVTNTAVYTSAFTPSTTPLTAVSGTQLLTCQSNRFVDNSSNAFAITVNGTPSVQRFSPFNPTASYTTATIGGSGYFDGSGDYLQLDNNSAWDLGSNNFTVEAWCYPTSSGSNVVITRAANGSTYPTFELAIYSGTWRFYSSSSSSAYNVELNSNVAPKLNEWQHVAVTRSGSTYTIWINGVSANTATSSASLYANSNVVGIGAYPNNTNRFYGYLSDVRLVNGTAVYSSTFTPPTAPLTNITNTQLLTNMTNAGIPDSAMMNDLETVGNAQVSTSVKKFGTGSIYLDGTGDALVPPASPLYNFGTGNFTIECWFNLSSKVAGQAPICQVPDTGAGSWRLSTQDFSGNDKLQLVARDGSWNTVLDISTTWNTGTWYYIAITRSGSTVYGFINGTLSGTGTFSTQFGGATKPLCIGLNQLDTVYFNGYVDDVRVTKGYARYTSTFTPPTQAFPTK